MQWWLAIFASAIILTWCSMRYESRQQKKAAKQMRQLQATRSVVSVEDFSQQCGAEVSPDIAGRVRQIIAEISVLSSSISDYKVDPARLHVDDLLCENLGYHLDSLAFIELDARLEEEFSIRLVPAEYKEQPTVRDVVLHVESTLKSRMG